MSQQLLFRAEPSEIALERGQTLGRGGDVRVGGVDLLPKEGDLLADLTESTTARTELLFRRRQIVREYLELRPDLTEPVIRFQRGVDHRGADQHPVGRDERRPAVLELHRDGLVHGVGQIHVAKDRADDPARSRFGVDHAEESSLAGSAQGDGPAGGDRKDRPTALVGVVQCERPVFVHDRVRERSERGHERPLEPGLDPNEVLQQSDGATLVVPQEPGAWGFFDVRAPSVEEVLARPHAPPGLLELLHLVREAPAFVLEPVPTLRERRGLAVQLLDVPLDGLALGFDRGDPFLNRGEVLRESLALVLGARERPLERLALGASPGGLFADPAAQILDLAAMILLLPVRRLRRGERRFLRLELGDRVREQALDPSDLLGDRIQPGRAGRLGCELRTRVRFAVDGLPVALLGSVTIERRGPEDLFGLGERARSCGPCVGGREHLLVERVQALARLRPLD